MRKIKFLLPVVLFLIISFIYIPTLSRGNFLDEQENWTGSWLLSQNKELYRDFFTHHAPLPYMVGQFLIPFINGQFIFFRILMFVIFLTILFTLWRSFPQEMRPGVGMAGILITLCVPKFNLHQYIASSLAAWGLLLAVGILLAITQRRYIIRRDMVWFGIGIFTAFWSAPATAPAILMLLVWLWLLGRTLKARRFSTQYAALVLLFAFLVPGYFWLKKDLNHFWWSVVSYNNRFYAPMRLGIKGPMLISVLTSGFDFLRLGLLGTIEPLNTFGQTCLHVILAFKTTFLSWPQLFTVAFISWWEKMAVLPVLSFWLFSLTVGLWFRYIHKRTAVFLALVLLALQWQQTEPFHRAPFIAVLLLATGCLLGWLVNKRKWPAALPLGVMAVWLITLVWPVYAAHVSSRDPLIAREEVHRSAIIQSRERKLMVINNSPITYLLSGSLPIIKPYYVFEWIWAVPEFKHEIIQAIRQGKAEVIVVGTATGSLHEEWLEELTKLLDEGYAAAGEGIYLKKSSNSLIAPKAILSTTTF